MINQKVCTRYRKEKLLSGLAEYLCTIGYLSYICPRKSRPKKCTYTPYIFSEEELGNFFRAADTYPSHRLSNRHIVDSILFRLIYGCGLRLSEALNLKLNDVNITDGTLTILQSKNNKDRKIPMAASLVNRCEKFNREMHQFSDGHTYYFKSPFNKRLDNSAAYRRFREYLWYAGIPHSGHGPSIINILNSYKFTIEENTPLEQEIALDPELLGKIFENLLASYNPETRTTARKQTGSYYTPREIVNYMVDESLIAYLKTKLSEKTNAFQQLGGQQTNMYGHEGKVGQLDIQIDLAASKWDKKEEELEEKLRHLFAYENDINPFHDDEETTQAIIAHLSECKILDPACGSGAFPMGILHKMVFALGKLDPFNYTWKQAQFEKARRDKQRALQFEDDSLRETALKSAEEKITYIEASFGETGHELDYARKLFLIENCLYGVDIQQIAVQISKLRFFISLMVDQRVDDSKLNRNILSLPNLETKFVAANTLIPVDKPQQGTIISMDANVKKVEQALHEIRQRIFFTKKWPNKRKLKKQEHDKRKELEKTLISSGFPAGSAGQIASWDPFDPLHTAPFFDPEVMFTIEKDKKGGYFDVLLGNPPYIKEYTFKKAFDGVRDSKYYKGKMDIWYMFACIGLDLIINNSGHLCFIATNNWVTNFGASILRKKIVNDAKIIQLLDFNNYKIFETADIQTMVMLFQNNSRKDNYNIDYRRLSDNSAKLENVLQLLQKEKTNCIIIRPTFKRHLYKERYILFAPKKEELVLNKIASGENFRLLENGDKRRNILPEIGQGIVAPQDSLNKSGYGKLLGDHNIGEGIFFLTKDEYKKYPWNNNELDLIRPLFNSKQIKKYWTSSEYSNFVIYTDSRFKGSNLRKVRSPIKINNYPNIKRHLDAYSKIITSDNKPYGLHRSREERLFEGEKILVLRKCSGSPIFSYCNFESYVSQSYNIIKTNRVNYLFLLGLLNSKLIAFWLKYRGKMQGINYQLDSEPLSQIPINVPSDTTLFEELVNNIIAKVQNNQNINRNVICLDVLFYKLYSLTYEECKIVDPEIEELISHEDYEGKSIEELAEYEINN